MLKNVQNIQKGKISSFAYTNPDEPPSYAKVLPDMESKGTTPELLIPDWLVGEKGDLQVQTEVVFVLFEDNTGMILTRADGRIF